MTDEFNQLRETLMEKIMTRLLAMSSEELVGVSKLFGVGVAAEISEAIPEEVKDEDELTEEETMIGWINQLIAKGGTAGDVLDFLLTGTEDVKSRLVSILSVLGYQLKAGVEYTEDILQKVTIQALIKQGATESFDLDDITDERPTVTVVNPVGDTGTRPPAFDYRNIKVNKPKENGVPIHDQINELISKVGGTNLTEDDLIMITTWNETYTPEQIFQSLKKTFDNSVFSLKSTNARLKVDFPSDPEEPGDKNAKPRRVGKFGLGEGE